MILYFVINVISAYFSSGFADYWFFPFIALLFLCTFPVILRDVFIRRSH